MTYMEGKCTLGDYWSRGGFQGIRSKLFIIGEDGEESPLVWKANSCYGPACDIKLVFLLSEVKGSKTYRRLVNCLTLREAVPVDS